jgi:hypothetical protein
MSTIHLATLSWTPMYGLASISCFPSFTDNTSGSPAQTLVPLWPSCIARYRDAGQHWASLRLGGCAVLTRLALTPASSPNLISVLLLLKHKIPSWNHMILDFVTARLKQSCRLLFPAMSFPVRSQPAIAPTPPELDYDKPPLSPVLPPQHPPAWTMDQRPFAITLDAYSLVMIAASLVLLLHYLGRFVAEAVIVLVPIALFVHNDFQNYLNLGPGGTPSTFRGYLRISWLHLWSLRNPFKAPRAAPDLVPSSGLLRKQPLPYRAGPRPQIAGIAPQRQLDQHGSYQCFQGVRQALEGLGRKIPEKFSTERSFIEKHGLALFARYPLQPKYQGEICHVHDAEYSMHMALHPDDIEEVLKKGWGQRHPLAWSWRSITMPVSPHFVLAYAPRDEQELQTICKIIQAAIWYTTAQEIPVSPCFES